MIFTESNIEDIIKDINSAYQSINEKYGIILVPGRVNITSSKTKFTTTIVPHPEEYKDISSHFIAHCSKYGLNPEDSRKILHSDEGKTLKIVGVSERKHKYGIILEDQSHNIYNMSKEQVSKLIRKSEIKKFASSMKKLDNYK